MPNTFIIRSQFLDNKYAKSVFVKKGWKEASMEDKKITFMYLDGKNAFNKKTYRKICVLKNDVKLSKKLNKDKWEFYKAYKIMFPHSTDIPTTWDMGSFISTITEGKEGQYYIMRPAGGRKGMGISLAKSPEEVKLLSKKFTPLNLTREAKEKKIYSFVSSKNYGVVVSEYIMNPMLFRERVFHIRMYLVISFVGGVFRSYLLKKGRILTASEPFDIKRAELKSVRDSHLDSTATDYMFPDDLKLISATEKNLIKQIKKISNRVSHVLSPTISCYPGISNCFSLYGMDFMISRERKLAVKLIEVNGSDSGFTSKTPKFRLKYTKMVFDNIFTQFINPAVYKKRGSGDWYSIY